MTIINNGHVPQACVLAIGKFEGIHLGHQTLLAEVIRQAGVLGLASVAMVFDPHPYICLGDPWYKPLFSNNERNHLLEDDYLFNNVLEQTTPLELDYLYYCPFDKNFASLPPKDFCKFLFVDCKAKLVIVGENYRFGKNRVGDTILLKDEAKHYGATVQVLPIQNLHSDILSTSTIRNLIAEGQLKKAQQLLGFPFFAMGTVENENGALTIRIPDDKFLPPEGVYASNTIVTGAVLRSITRVGTQIETHIQDYKLKGLCGELVKIEFLEITPSGE